MVSRDHHNGIAVVIFVVLHSHFRILFFTIAYLILTGCPSNKKEEEEEEENYFSHH